MPEKEVIDLSTIKCLIVEDNLINQKILAKFVKKVGIEADFANDGLQGVEAFKQQPYDLIFMDLQMPRMDGIEATRQILNDCNEKQPIIIAVTANTSDKVEEKCKDCGMKDYISKPVTFKVIQEAIHKYF